MSRIASIVIHCTDPYVAGPFWSLALNLPPVEIDAVALRERTLPEGESVLLRDTEGKRTDVWVSPHPDAADRDRCNIRHMAASKRNEAAISRIWCGSS